jgi:tRNA threonylcarbamoyladenosine modification (KEOPS) complex  Pcc1 subunit
MLDKMRNSSGETTEAVFKQVLEELHNKLNMSYFENETTLEGDKITSKVTAEDLSKLSGSVAYIGDNKNLEEFIKTHLNPGTTFTAMDKDSVQGKEFDYVIVDSDWGGRMAKGADGKFKYE